MAINGVSPKVGKILALPSNAPTIGTATDLVNGGGATVAFTAADASVGGPIFNYIGTSSPGSITATGTTSPLTFSGLTVGIPYTFSVQAKNSSGVGPASGASNSITPSNPAGSYDSIATVTPSGTTTVTFSSIPTTYKHLQIRVISQQDYSTAGDFGWLNTTFNGSTANYVSHFMYASAGQSFGATGLSFMYSADSFLIPSGNNSPIFGAAIIDILDYGSTTKYKTMRVMEGVDWGSNGMMREVSGLWQSTSAINSITLTGSNGAFKAGSHFALYGVKG